MANKIDLNCYMVLIITSVRHFIQIKRMTYNYNLKNSGSMLLIAGLLILIQITWTFARQVGCDERGPICGNDGRTYQTMCQLIWARLEDTDLQVLHEGSCNEQVSGTPYQGQFMTNQKLSSGYSKLKAVMPYGWPPMGPVVNQMSLLMRTDEERHNRLNAVPEYI